MTQKIAVLCLAVILWAALAPADHGSELWLAILVPMWFAAELSVIALRRLQREQEQLILAPYLPALPARAPPLG